MAKPLQFEDAVLRARGVHGDKYEYLRLDRVLGKLNIVYVCKLHGEHSQGIHRHFYGAGCFKCGAEARGKASRVGFEEVKAKALGVHGDKYVYSKVEYGVGKGKGRSVLHYICPSHGEQSQSVSHHLAGHGCPACGFIKGAETRTASFKNPLPEGLPITYFESFKIRAAEIHMGVYRYLDMFQKNKVRYIRYICPTHGKRTQSAGNHLAGKGCKSCAVTSSGLLRRTSFEDYTVKAAYIHDSVYTYEKLDYSASKAIYTIPALLTGK